MAPTRSNPERLRAFVADCLDLAARQPPAQAANFLDRNAERLRSRLEALAAWAAADGVDAPADHFSGLTAFDLLDAADALSAAALRRVREGRTRFGHVAP